MEEDGEIKTPFWEQSTTNLRRIDRFNRRLSSLIFSSGVLLFFLLVTAIFFVVFVIPMNLSYSPHIFRPKSVMKNWDSLNLVLVLVALFFGFLSKNKNNDSDLNSDSIVSSNVVGKSEPLTPNKWYDNYSDRPEYGKYSGENRSRFGGMRRNSVSYPDFQLRDQFDAGEYDRWRYYDDTNVDSYRIVESDRPVYYRRRGWKEYDRKEFEVKNVYVDNAFNSRVDEEKEEAFYDWPVSAPAPPSPPPPPPPPPPRRQKAEEKGKRISQNRAYEQDTSSFTVFSPPSPSPPPPPPPPPPRRRMAEQKGKRMSRSLAYEQKTSKDVGIAESELARDLVPPALEKQAAEKSSGSYYKKRNGGNTGKDHNFLSSFYQKKKKKRQRQRSVDNLDAFLYQTEMPQTYKPPPPPPPLPPPPSYSVLHNLFSTKKTKRRRIPSDPHPHFPNSTPPPPPPPPPQFKAARITKPLKIQPPLTTYKAPLPIKIKSFNSIDDNSSSGGSSPLPSIPPPPPPPFKMPEWKYIVEGDYVSIQSNPSSRSGSPDTDEAGNNSPEAQTTSSEASLFCPSPDVDTKADNFIARFRAGLKLEKIDSFNKKQGSRLSNLGPASQN